MFARNVAAVSAISLVVHLYDAFGVPAGDLALARATARAILSDAGIAVMWRDCPCDEGRDGQERDQRQAREAREQDGEPAPVEIVIRIVGAPAASQPDSLGFSYVDVARRAGTLATVFADRVQTMSALAGGDGAPSGPLLGRAMAHEMGHLLLGTTAHPGRGLMRGRWTAIELVKNQPWDWTLSREDASEMRRALAIRQRQPAAIVARQ